MRRPLPFALALLFLGGAPACSSDELPPDASPADAQGDGGPGADTGLATDGGGTLPDGGVQPIVDGCNPLTQTGCTDPLKNKCVVESATPRGGAQCAEPGVDEKRLHEACTGGECLPSLVCVNTSTAPLCHQLCDPSSGQGCEALGADAECGLRLRDTNWGACTQLGATCDAVTQAPCTVDQACQFVRRANGNFELRCQTAGPGTDGSACGGANPRCARGFVCVSEAGESKCRQFCANDGQCPQPSRCSGVVQGLSYCR